MSHIRTWHDFLSQEKEKSYFRDIISYVIAQRNEGKIIYPAQKDIFNAFRFTKFANVKVIILGQDPYHGPNQAHGLSFSVLPGVSIPPSLMNIYKELVQDISGFTYPGHGCLQSWAEQGVLLMNTVLTVEAGKSYSHANIGWEKFTDRVITILNEHLTGIIFLLWGAYAQKKSRMIDRKRNFVLTAPHPSPFSAHRGFFGCCHFSQVNKLLKQQALELIRWQLPKQA